jgi:hypothetical protein
MQIVQHVYIEIEEADGAIRKQYTGRPRKNSGVFSQSMFSLCYTTMRYYKPSNLCGTNICESTAEGAKKRNCL